MCHGMGVGGCGKCWYNCLLCYGMGVGGVVNGCTAAYCATLALRTLFALNFACGVCDNFLIFFDQ